MGVHLGSQLGSRWERQFDFQMEQLALLRESIDCCEKAQDYVSREILEDILGYEEQHVDWLEAQQYLIDNSGLENYLQAKMSDD